MTMELSFKLIWETVTKLKGAIPSYFSPATPGLYTALNEPPHVDIPSAVPDIWLKFDMRDFNKNLVGISGFQLY
jgi:hypothetical protein